MRSGSGFGDGRPRREGENGNEEETGESIRSESGAEGDGEAWFHGDGG